MATTGWTSPMTTEDFNSSNVTATTEPPPKPAGLQLAYNILLACITIVIMFSMGTGVAIRDVKRVLRRPVGPIIGLICQCFLMPAACCGYAFLLQLDDNLAIGMVLVGSCPGGSISNMCTYWTRADIALSVTMTTISTTLALLFLPLNMFIYSRFWVDDMTNMPYGNMAISVLYVWAAALLGIFTGWMWPQTIRFFTIIGSAAAVILILTAGVIQGKLYPELFDLPWTAWFGSITMPIIGFGIGMILASIACLGWSQKFAIGFETGIQNTALALTVIAITFPSSWESSYYSQFVLLYTTFQVVLVFTIILSVWAYIRIRYCESPFERRDDIKIGEPDELEDVVTADQKRRKTKALGGDNLDENVAGIYTVPCSSDVIILVTDDTGYTALCKPEEFDAAPSKVLKEDGDKEVVANGSVAKEDAASQNLYEVVNDEMVVVKDVTVTDKSGTAKDEAVEKETAASKDEVVKKTD